MPPTGSTFTDWQQVERESRLFTEGDFDWAEPPRRRRRITEAASPARRRVVDESIRASRRPAVLEYEPELLDDYEASTGYEPLADDMPPAPSESWDHHTASHSHFDEMMEQWNAAYGVGARRDSHRSERASGPERAFDLSDPGGEASALAARRTVLITGRGDERYMPALRRPRSSELRFHERSGFSPDRAGLWAVLLGIALVIGAIAH